MKHLTKPIKLESVPQAIAYKWIDETFYLDSISVSLVDYNTLKLFDGTNSALIQYKDHTIKICFLKDLSINVFPYH